MFETAEIGRKIPNKEFKKAALKLREELLDVQDELHRRRGFSVILVFAGVDGAGKGETVNLLNEWMDARWLKNRAYDEPNDSERERPEFWKYWRDLPARGSIGMFLSAWYSAPLLDRVYDTIDEATFLKRLTRIVRFERALSRDGAVILKFWMHLSRDAQEQRLRSLESIPLTAARVSERDWRNWENYGKFVEVAEQVIARTNRGIAPWNVVEGADANYRSLVVTTALRDAIRKQLQAQDDGSADQNVSAKRNDTAEPKAKSKNSRKKSAAKAEDGGNEAAGLTTILDQLDMSQRLTKSDYRRQLVELQERLYVQHLEAKARKISSVLLFEGEDAAGKGGAIRRIIEALDARNYQVHGIAAPSDEERAQHYLWRFWRRHPPAGRISIFDRSWYGRVLVERVEGFASEDEWRRAYAEINEFEDQLIEHGTVLVKYWVHITKDEQLARFKLRKKTPYKRWKLTEEDWRNRRNWRAYEEAVHDMVQFTSTSKSPWTLVEGNDKRFARIKVLKTFSDRLAEALGETSD